MNRLAIHFAGLHHMHLGTHRLTNALLRQFGQETAQKRQVAMQITRCYQDEFLPDGTHNSRQYVEVYPVGRQPQGRRGHEQNDALRQADEDAYQFFKQRLPRQVTAKWPAQLLPGNTSLNEGNMYIP